MTGRRSFLAGLLATGLVPTLTWADAGSPAYLAAAKRPDGAFVLAGLSASGQRVFELPLPHRGHAAAAHPIRPEAVAFARRPGTYAVIVDCARGYETARLTAPEGRHFYGHGAFSADGALLFTTENDFDAARGMVGVWDVRGDYRRIGEFPSGGTGPHDIKLMPDGKALVVANGGIETHPETGRTKLNLHAMRPNLSYLDLAGRIVDQAEPDEEYRMNSIRHLAVGPGGEVVFAMQWQGDIAQSPPLVGRHRRSHAIDLLHSGSASQLKMLGYAGSVALSAKSRSVAVTSPRGGLCLVFQDGRVQEHLLADVCGVASSGSGFVMTAGNGEVVLRGAKTDSWVVSHDRQWDNHLIALENA